MLRSDCDNSNVIRTTVKPYYAVTSKPSARTIWLCLSCTPFIPVAQNSRDNSETCPLNLLQSNTLKRQQWPPGPALIRWFGAACSHSVQVPTHDSAQRRDPPSTTWNPLWSCAEIPSMAFIGPRTTARAAGD